jgi:hypothetical protein
MEDRGANEAVVSNNGAVPSVVVHDDDNGSTRAAHSSSAICRKEKERNKKTHKHHSFSVTFFIPRLSPFLFCWNNKIIRSTPFRSKHRSGDLGA